MSAEAITALKAKFPQATDRASADHPAVNLPLGDLVAALRFLRDEFAHRRLGFSDREVESWFAAAGLANAGSEIIAPTGEGEKLTVKLWLATAKAKAKKEAA